MSYKFGQVQWEIKNGEIAEKINLLEDKNITQLGIQGPPGLKFKIKPISEDSSLITTDEVILNETGMIDIDLRNSTCFINSLSLPKQTIDTNIKIILVDYIDKGTED